MERSVSRRFTEARLFLGLFTVQVIIGASLALTHINLISLLIGTQVLQGIVTPVILVYILILTNRRSVLGKAVNKPVFRVVASYLRGGHLGDEPAPARLHDPRLLRDRIVRDRRNGGRRASGHEAVAHAGFGEQVAGAGGLGLELAA